MVNYSLELLKNLEINIQVLRLTLTVSDETGYTFMSFNDNSAASCDDGHASDNSFICSSTDYANNVHSVSTSINDDMSMNDIE